MTLKSVLISLMHDASGGWGVALLVSGSILIAACAQPTPVPMAGSTPDLVVPASPTTGSITVTTKLPPVMPTPTSGLPLTADATATPESQFNPVRLEITDKSEARYLVREQFARRNVPNDAIGRTRKVAGSILFDAGGKVVPGESIFRVDLSTLVSDEDDRDDYLRGESLESDQFPFAEFVVMETIGLPLPLPLEGAFDFQLQGEMTIHDNTSPLVWDVTAQSAGDRIEGTARTNFDFARFRLVRPSRLFLLSVEDNIRLELDFVVAVTQLAE